MKAFLICFLISMPCFGDWVTSDYLSEDMVGFTFAMAQDSHGNLFAAGGAGDDFSEIHWLVRRSQDEGKTWTTVDEVTSDSTRPYFAHSIVTTPTGEIFVGGFEYRSLNNDYWMVRKSVDEGKTWETVDRYNVTDSSMVNDGGILNGTVFFVGITRDSKLGSQIIMRSTNDGGANWVLNVVDSGQVYVSPRMTITPKGVIYVSVGAAESLEAPERGLVFKSLDEGKTWIKIDTFVLDPNDPLGARWSGIYSDKRGTLYTAGSSYQVDPNNGKELSHWIIRKSEDDGTTWDIIDDWYDGKTPLYAMDVIIHNGELLTIGGSFGEGDLYDRTWFVRNYSRGRWTFSDRVIGYAGAGRFFASKMGNLFACGYGENGWLIRVLAPFGNNSKKR